uniref:Uncharacterized protein n=1 Tax=Cacopsylla melanoneura TaxID=428564 RepID=A0A8D8Z7V2_9HEMI
MAFHFLSVILVATSICATKVQVQGTNNTKTLQANNRTALQSSNNNSTARQSSNKWHATTNRDLKTFDDKNNTAFQDTNSTFKTWKGTANSDSKTWRDTTNRDSKTWQDATIDSLETFDCTNSTDLNNSTNSTRINPGCLGDDNTEDVVVVFGTPQNETEDIMKTVEEIGHKVGIQNPLKDVLKAERSPVPELEPDPIVIHLHNATIKDNWTDAYAGKQFQQADEWWHHLPKHVWVLNNETKPLSEVEKLNATAKEQQDPVEEKLKQTGKEKELKSKAKKEEKLKSTTKEKEHKSKTKEEKKLKPTGKEKDKPLDKKEKLKAATKEKELQSKEKDLKSKEKEQKLKAKEEKLNAKEAIKKELKSHTSTDTPKSR